MTSEPRSAGLTAPSIRWLMGAALACLLGVLGLKLFFDNLQDQSRAQSANERARLFVGDDIVRHIQGIEKEMYRMMAATSEADVARIRHGIDRHIENTERNLDVLQKGGRVERRLPLNLEGRDEMTQAVDYRPNLGTLEPVMEIIEIAPLLDKIGEMADTFEILTLRRLDCEERQDRFCLERVEPELLLFLKQLPAHVQRISENANRLYFHSNEHLIELETQLLTQRETLKQVEMGLVALVIVLAGLFALHYLRRIDQANAQLASALDAMRAAKDEAERASRAKSEFVSRMSHELRTPLNAIIGFADLLEAEPLSPSHKNYVNLINSSGKHLMELINAVLDHAKIEAGGLTLEQIAFDFPAAIEAVKTIVAERANAKGLDFVASIAADLPRHICGDPTRLRQVLINLLVNAIKFTEHGAVELRVAVADERIVFSVRDTGIGMDAAALGRLFQPFSQADDSITRKFGGTGLGLMISKELIEAMGGAIEVESAPDVGTCFWFWLPLRAADAAPVGATVGAASASAIAALVTGRVLLVDDNRINQQLAGAMLDRLGLAYDCADNGAHALRRLASAEYALVLMDMEMPEMDGVAATRAIRAAEAAHGTARLPIVAMTANAMQEDRERCFAAGMDGYIAKPIALSMLQDELRRLFAGNSAAPASSAAHSTAADGPVFDRATAVAMMGDEELFKELARLYIADVPGYLAALDAALAAEDSERLARAAHTLKGLFATFAAAPGEAVARQLEQAARGDDRNALAALAASVRQHGETLAAALVE